MLINENGSEKHVLTTMLATPKGIPLYIFLVNLFLKGLKLHDHTSTIQESNIAADKILEFIFQYTFLAALKKKSKFPVYIIHKPRWQYAVQ